MKSHFFSNLTHCYKYTCICKMYWKKIRPFACLEGRVQNHINREEHQTSCLEPIKIQKLQMYDIINLYDLKLDTYVQL